eukprot:c16603_g1_i1.p1 GENE.c16603_g1_i1~~c16603_g1_i1.p1  ORF type:complete len:225 (-),score=62.57 c16603_g1_i1:81-704(-)
MSTLMWIREDKDNWQGSADGEFEISCVQGSIWGSPESRLKNFGADDGLAKNILVQETGAQAGEKVQGVVTIEFVPDNYGAQAGILVYKDDGNYVKFVIEGNKTGGAMILLAEQINFNPRVVNKVDVSTDTFATTQLALTIQDNALISAQYRPVSSDNSNSEWLTLWEASAEQTLTHDWGHFGVMAHSAADPTKKAKFANFKVLKVVI